MVYQELEELKVQWQQGTVDGSKEHLKGLLATPPAKSSSTMTS